MLFVETEFPKLRAKECIADMKRELEENPPANQEDAEVTLQMFYACVKEIDDLYRETCDKAQEEIDFEFMDCDDGESHDDSRINLEKIVQSDLADLEQALHVYKEQAFALINQILKNYPQLDEKKTRHV